MLKGSTPPIFWFVAEPQVKPAAASDALFGGGSWTQVSGRARYSRLAVYPPGANPFNDILIAFLFFLWIFNGTGKPFAHSTYQGRILSHHSRLWWYHFSNMNDAPFVISGANRLLKRSSSSERTTTDGVVPADETANQSAFDTTHSVFIHRASVSNNHMED